MEHQMSHLFALPLYKASLNREFSAEERRFFQNELRDPILAISNYSSRNKNVLDAEAMQGIRKFLQSHLDNFFRITFNTANEVSLQITQSWLTRSLKSQSHHPHTHPQQHHQWGPVHQSGGQGWHHLFQE